MYTVLTHFSYKAMRHLGKHTRCDFRTHSQLDAHSVMCSWKGLSLHARYLDTVYVTGRNYKPRYEAVGI